ncbi:MAG: KH domain-containing protein [Leptospiraceae bacterium]|nr:KH domain-containing protein [Leptospiraceae bacterium]
MKSDPIGLVDYIVRSLVKHPDDVQLLPIKGPSSLVMELRVNPEDLGSVIGKGGRIARALRILLNAISVKKITLEDGTVEKFNKIILEIIDD